MTTMANKGKRLAGAYTGIDRDSTYPMAEAIKLVKSKATAKFGYTATPPASCMCLPIRAAACARQPISRRAHPTVRLSAKTPMIA